MAGVTRTVHVNKPPTYTCEVSNLWLPCADEARLYLHLATPTDFYARFFVFQFARGPLMKDDL